LEKWRAIKNPDGDDRTAVGEPGAALGFSVTFDKPPVASCLSDRGGGVSAFPEASVFARIRSLFGRFVSLFARLGNFPTISQ